MMGSLPFFNAGQTLYANDLNKLVLEINRLSEIIASQKISSVGPGIIMNQHQNGVVLSLSRKPCVKGFSQSNHPRVPFEIYIKTNAAGTQSIFCDGNVLQQNYAVEGPDINYKGFSQFGIIQSQIVPAEFTGTYVVYVLHNQVGATGTSLLIEQQEQAPEETILIGRVKFTKGVPAIEQTWTGSITFVSVDPMTVVPKWESCPCYDCGK